MSKIKGQVKIAPNGRVTFRTSTGDFSTGAPLISTLAGLMQAAGVTFTSEAVPEQHKHDDDPKELERTGREHSH